MIAAKLDLLKFTLSASDRLEGQPLHEAIVTIARQEGLAGASVFRAELGLGHDHQVQDVLNEYASTDPPLTVEIVDEPLKIESLLEKLRSLPATILITRSSSAPVDALITSAPADAETPEMTSGTRAQRLSVYLGSNDTWQGTNLAVALVEHCRALGYAGVTVTRGVMGFGKSTHVHKAQPFHFAQELPEKFEMIDTPERVATLLTSLDGMVNGTLVVVENVEIIHAKHR